MIDTRLLAELRSELVATDQRPPWRTGIVSVVNAAPPSVDVSVGGASVVAGVRYLSTYAPVVGDTVVVLERSGDRVVLGRLA